MRNLSEHASQKPKVWFWAAGLLSAILITLVALPGIAPLKIDTDPENMLSETEDRSEEHTSELQSRL